MNTESLSSLMLASSVIVFVSAFVAHTAEWAVAHRGEQVTTSSPVTDEQPAVAASVAGVVHGVRDTAGPPEVRDPRGAALGAQRPPRVDLCGRIGLAMTAIAWLLTLGGVLMRGVAGQRLPWGNMMEFVTTAMVFIVGGYLLLAWKADARWLGLPITMLAAIGNGLAITVFWVPVAPLVPALQSVWFVIHIVAAAISGAAFNIGGVAAVLYLLKTRAERREAVNGYLRFIPSARTLDLYSYRFHAFAFPLWTFTVAAGAVWAEYAWGRYWGWDPKETWALITWVAYACYLHARATAGWKGGKAAAIALIGLATFWFNFVGINLLVSGLHSYAGV